MFVHFVDGPRLLPLFTDSLSVVLGVRFAFDLRDQALLQTLAFRRFLLSGMSWRLPCADGKIRAQGPTASRLNRRGLLQHVIGRRRDCHESRTSQVSSDAAPVKVTVAHMSGRGWFLPAKMAASSCGQLEGQEFEFTRVLLPLKLILCCGRRKLVCDRVTKWCSC